MSDTPETPETPDTPETPPGEPQTPPEGDELSWQEQRHAQSYPETQSAAAR